MANTGRNISGQQLDLSRIYGIDENMSLSQPSMDGLIGYSITPPSWNESMNNSSQSNASVEDKQQNEVDMRNNAQQNTMYPLPQRQEQTFPTSREPLENMQASDMSTRWQGTNVADDMRSFLQQQVGKNITIQFLIGADSLVEQTGTLVGVGKNYIVLREAETGKLLICNFDDIKFVRIESR